MTTAGASDVSRADDDVFGSQVPAGVGVHVDLVITLESLLGVTDTAAQAYGAGVIPALAARRMIALAAGRDEATLRLLYAHPETGALVVSESRARIFPDGLKRMLALRDGFCRYPFCDAPARHVDHIRPHAEGGATSYGQGQSLCAHHNLIKDAHDAVTFPERTDGTGAIITRLSNGAEYVSPARLFPHENHDSLVDGAYWAGYRAGRDTERGLLEDEWEVVDGEEDTLRSDRRTVRVAEEKLAVRAERLLVAERRLQVEQARYRRSVKIVDGLNEELGKVQQRQAADRDQVYEDRLEIRKARRELKKDRAELQAEWRELAELHTSFHDLVAANDWTVTEDWSPKVDWIDDSGVIVSFEDDNGADLGLKHPRRA